MTHLAAVPVADLLQWATDIEDEVGLDDIVVGLRAVAQCPDADIIEAIKRVRDTVLACSYCHGASLCSYHEGWVDGLDLLADQLEGVR
ncbi:MAG: hypothetical protein ACP5QO_16650 [Clostridia bacterium]